MDREKLRELYNEVDAVSKKYGYPTFPNKRKKKKKKKKDE